MGGRFYSLIPTEITGGFMVFYIPGARLIQWKNPGGQMTATQCRRQCTEHQKHKRFSAWTGRDALLV